ncbi:sigma factor [Streptosporangium sp. NPDC023615]|uniref:RNA polymerase sigma factor n=1 Tax=Streptosporangium sp. NPDC023615 TaxID=3154794 RepID=UPI00343660BD
MEPPPERGSAENTGDTVVARLFSTHRLGLVRLAFLLVGNQETAEDVVQDAFAALHRRWSRLADHDRVLPYLRTAVVNGCRMVHRRRAIVGRFAGERETPFCVWGSPGLGGRRAGNSHPFTVDEEAVCLLETGRYREGSTATFTAMCGRSMLTVWTAMFVAAGKRPERRSTDTVRRRPVDRRTPEMWS